MILAAVLQNAYGWKCPILHASACGVGIGCDFMLKCCLTTQTNNGRLYSPKRSEWRESWPRILFPHLECPSYSRLFSSAAYLFCNGVHQTCRSLDYVCCIANTVTVPEGSCLPGAALYLQAG
jgi:hypothetical protein